MTWARLEQQARPWLCLNGAHSQTIENDVQAVTKGFDYRWIWRDTAWEYESPGYRHGPLLLPLNEAKYTCALDQWLRRQAGMILLGPADGDTLVAHLQHLHHLVGADGVPISFSLHAARQLEELCEGLSPNRLSAMFGPIHRLIWHAGEDPSGEWLSADAPDLEQPMPALGEPIALTDVDQTALDHASFAWFMRDCMRDFCKRIPACGDPRNQAMIWRHLGLFVREATEQLALTTERDVRHYLELRVRYPQALFVNDAELRGVLVNRHVQARQRLIEVEARLAALVASTS